MIYPVKYGYQKRREDKNAKRCSLFPIPLEGEFAVMKRMFQLALE